MTEKEKFELEMCSIDDLCYLAQKAAKAERELKDILKHKSIDDKDYEQMKRDRHTNKRRLNYLKSRIKARQMKMF